MKELLSIIVPVYNVENYLSTCIDSILAQTYSPIELILVNDGSSDRSGEICNEYAAANKNIKVIHTPNGGVSRARNLGLDAANGKYIAFVDSDDWCEPQMYELLMDAAFATHADIAVCGGFVDKEEASLDVPSWITRTLSPQFVRSRCFSSKTFSVRGVEPYIFNKVYRKECIDRLDLRFRSDLVIGEDTVFLRTLLPQVETIIVLDEKLYHYRFNRKDSLSSSNTDVLLVGQRHLKVISALAEVWEAQDILERQKSFFMRWSLGYIYWQIVNLQSFELASEFISIWKRYNLLDARNLLSKENNKKLGKVLAWGNPDKTYRDKLIKRTEQKNRVKEKIKSRRFTSELFDIYWAFRHKGIKAALVKFKRIIKSRYFDFKRYVIRDGVKFHAKAVMRLFRLPSALEPYKGILEVKSRHEGESCFVVATGPSLTIEDVKKIEHLPTFAVNGTISLKDDADWHPMYYVLFDGRAYSKIKNELGSFDTDDFARREAFVNDLLRKDLSEEPKTQNTVFIPYCNGGNSDWWDVLHLRYTKNLLWGYYDLATVTNAAIHIAQYMGFKNIYLIGVDCDYSSPKQYFTDTKNANIKTLKSAQIAQARMFKAYSFMKGKMDKLGVNVFNATRGGALEVFPRVDLDEVIMTLNDEIAARDREDG